MTRQSDASHANITINGLGPLFRRLGFGWVGHEGSDPVGLYHIAVFPRTHSLTLKPNPLRNSNRNPNTYLNPNLTVNGDLGSGDLGNDHVACNVFDAPRSPCPLVVFSLSVRNSGMSTYNTRAQLWLSRPSE
jgi:hypothetical protein